MKKIIAYGTPFMDFLVGVDHLPKKKDEGAMIIQTSWQGGGKVSTALAAVGQLGGISAMMGTIGADTYGDFLLDDYHYYNIDTSHMIQDGKNAFSVVLSDPVTKGRNIIGRFPTSRPYTIDDIDEEFVKQYDILHLENANEVSHRLADIMHEKGGLVAVDADSYSDEMHAMINKYDIFIGSEFYYNSLFGEDASSDLSKAEENMRTLLELGPQIVVFTFGDKGSAAVTKDGYYFAHGYSVNVVDTVGAGDTYHGAYLFAIAKGMDPFESAQFANAVAAIKCTGIGGRSALPTYDMTIEFMKTGKCDRTLIEEKTRRYESFGKQ
ncbi:MAG: carbohydrate kinase family protein [Clostridia bacterium]|nr:carbohydrate kinase family protein [Clostridia bacterium]